MSAQIRAAAYWFFPLLTGERGMVEAGNETQRMAVRIGAEGAVLTMMEGTTWALRTPSLHGVEPVAAKERVTRRAGRLEEWWHNAARGLEHGYTLYDGNAADEQRIALEIGTSWQAQASADGRGVTFSENGVRRLGYDGLRAWDATGRDLPARMELADAGLTLCVQTHGAQWPVTIDPLITTGSGFLQAAETESGDFFGWSTILDGNWLMVSAPGRQNANGGTGAVYFFQFDEAAQTWVQRQKIGAPDANTRFFGKSMAAHGDRLAVYAGAASGAPRVVIIQRTATGGTLTAEQANLTGMDNGLVPVPLALEGTALIVGPLATAVEPRTVRAFRRVGGIGGAFVWSPVTVNAGTAPGYTVQGFGTSVALRGGVLAVGAPGTDQGASLNKGSMHLFSYGGTWAQTGWFAADSQSEQLGTALAMSQPDTVQVLKSGSGGYRMVPDAAQPGGWKVSGYFSNGLETDIGPFTGLTSRVLAATGTQVLSAYQSANAPPVQARLFRETVAGTSYERVATPGLAETITTLRSGSLGSEWMALGVEEVSTVGQVAMWRRTGHAWVPAAAVRAAETDAGDHFGSVLAGDGRTLVVGAPERDNILRGGPNVGAVYVFVADDTQTDAWKLQTTLLGTGTISGDRFGAAVALDGESIAVGAPGHDNAGAADAGEVYLFRRPSSAWTQTGVATSSTAGQQLGTAVVLTDGWLIAGAPGAGNGGVRYAARTANTLGAPAALITAPGVSTGLRAGAALCLHDGRLLLGAPGRNAGTAGKAWLMPADSAAHPTVEGVTVREFLSPAANEASFGATVLTHGARVFVAAPGAGSGLGRVWQWSLDTPAAAPLEMLALSPTVRLRALGTSLAWLGDRLLVGAPLAVAGATECGAVFVSDAGAPLLLRRYLLAHTPRAGQKFGSAVCGDGPLVWAGAPGDDAAGDEAGAAFAWQDAGSDWTTSANLAPASDANDRLGESVDIDGDFAIIGAPGDEGPGNATDSGTAYILSRRTGWDVEARLYVTGQSTGDDCGKSVAISGQTVVIGAPGRAGTNANGNPVTKVGRAYIFTRVAATAATTPAWNLVTTLLPPAFVTGGGAEFGESVAIDGDLIFVGAPGAGSGAGTARLHGRREVYDAPAAAPWVFLRSHETSLSTRLGRAVALDGQRCAVLGERSTHVSNLYLAAFDYDRTDGQFYGISNQEFALAGTQSGDTPLVASMRVHVSLDGPHLALAWADDNNQHIDFFNAGNLTRSLRIHTPNGIESAMGSSVALDHGRALLPRYSSYGTISGTTSYSTAVLWQWDEGTGNWDYASQVAVPATAYTRIQVALSGSTAVICGGSPFNNIHPLYIAELEGSSDYHRWLRAQFTSLTVDNPALEASTWGDLADPDKDGLSNIEEAYGGTSPVLAGGSGFYDAVERSGSELIIRWRRSGEDHGVRALAQWSPDLARWYVSGDGPDAANFRTITLQNLGDPFFTGQDTIEARLPMTTGSRGWLRLLLQR